MTDQHPITPPPELMQQWAAEYWNDPGEPIGNGEKYIATQAARWGADQELEAGVNYIDNNISGNKAREFRAIRRPKPPSLKEQALSELEEIMTELHDVTGSAFTASVIRRALEALDD